MKRVENIIDMARKLSGNTRYDSDSGIPQDVFVQFLVNANDSLQKEVANLKTKFLKKTTTVAVVSGQEVYSYPSDCFVQHIDTIQYTNALVNSYYINLEKSVQKERLSNANSNPYGYILENNGYLLNPPITSGYLLVSYDQAYPRPQKRCGQITARTLAGQTLSALTVATTGSYDTLAINADYYLCVVDQFGVQKATNVVYTSEAAGVFTITSQSLTAGETIAVGDYITVGKHTANIPYWPSVCESYLLKHMVYDAKFMDASTWTNEAKNDMAMFFMSLSGSFATNSNDLCPIPITQTDLL